MKDLGCCCVSCCLARPAVFRVGAMKLMVCLIPERFLSMGHFKLVRVLPGLWGPHEMSLDPSGVCDAQGVCCKERMGGSS